MGVGRCVLGMVYEVVVPFLCKNHFDRGSWNLFSVTRSNKYYIEMERMHTTTKLILANTAFLMVMGLFTFYFVQNRNDASVDVKKLMLVLGASAVAQVILFFMKFFQGGIRLDADSDKLLRQ
jgi:hypothetical protein